VTDPLTQTGEITITFFLKVEQNDFTKTFCNCITVAGSQGVTDNTKGKPMKVQIAFNVLCFILFTISAVLSAFQGNWFLTALWSFSTLCCVACGVPNYKTLKRRGY
jgi:hypothetical protein